MNSTSGPYALTSLSQVARRAVEQRDWATVAACAETIKKQYRKDPEGFFLSGLVDKARREPNAAAAAFAQALNLDARRYDAAIELAGQYVLLLRHGEAADLLRRYENRLGNSPLYLHLAASTYSRLGLHGRAWPLYRKADSLQPGIDSIRADLAGCSVLVGHIEEARVIYRELLDKYPHHQRNHYELSRLARARDASHIEEMMKVLEDTRLPPEKNIFLYYAIGKELEDLERWDEAFGYYELAGDTISNITDYDVASDIAPIDKTIEVCSAAWLEEPGGGGRDRKWDTTPIFIVGLPRTGTTLLERIIASHSRVETADETFFLQMAIRQAAVGAGAGEVTPEIIGQAARKNIRSIAGKYMSWVDYRLGGRPFFIDKYPLNFLYLGFIAKAFPGARLIHMRRNPMDACFALYKQSFFKFAYTLENLGRYYVAFERLRRHWQDLLQDRLIEIDYENLVADQEDQTRALLDRMGLPFEQACLEFERNAMPSASASTVQVREKIHTRSVGKWEHFRSQLQPLKDYLEQAGIKTE